MQFRAGPFRRQPDHCFTKYGMSSQIVAGRQKSKGHREKVPFRQMAGKSVARRATHPKVWEHARSRRAATPP